MKKRLTAIFLVISLLAASFVSCSEAGENTADDTKTSSTEIDPGEVEAAEEEVSRENYPDNLPEKDYEGRNWNLFTRTGFEDKFFPEELSGETLNDALYQRNIKIAERYNVDLTFYAEASNWGNASWNNTLTNSVAAGDGAFDCVAAYAASISDILTKQVFMNWRDVPYIDFSAPWWSQTASEAFTVNGKQFYLTGDYSIGLWDYMCCFFFNKVLVQNYNLDNMYDIVREKKWTLDYLVSTASSVSQDLNGNGVWEESDMYGLVSDWATGIDTFQISTKMAVVSHTPDGSLEITLNSERAMTTLEKVTNLYNDSRGAYLAASGDFPGMFTSDRALFFASAFINKNNLRDMESDFGIIPYPMFDENQDNYASTSLDSFDVFIIPIDVKDIEFSGIITEALCAESWRSVIPQYYDIVLKVKNSRDEESAEMIDIIRDNLTYDYGYLCSSALGGLGHVFVNLVRANSTDLASKYKSIAKPAQKMLDKMLEAYGIN